jgi:hypothetical protein
MKAQRGSRGTVVLSKPRRYKGWVVKFRLRLLYNPGMIRYTLYTRLGWPQSRLGRVFAKRKSITPIGDRTFFEGNMEGRMKVMRGIERRNKTPLDDLKEKRGYWNPKEEAVGRSLWRTRFGRGYGLVIRQQNDQ